MKTFVKGDIITGTSINTYGVTNDKAIMEVIDANYSTIRSFSACSDKCKKSPNIKCKPPLHMIVNIKSYTDIDGSERNIRGMSRWTVSNCDKIFRIIDNDRRTSFSKFINDIYIKEKEK